MFEELVYKKPNFIKDHTIEYIKYGEDEVLGKVVIASVQFLKRKKSVIIDGTFTFKELQAINKQVEELGWK